MCETLREPVKVLKSLSEQAKNKQYKFKRLYRNLYNPEFYFLAYKNISKSQGSMTPGVDGKSLDGMSEKRINALIDSLKDFSYRPNPARRVYIEKKNSTKKRPLGIPSTEDKLVQEVARMILESIYEPTFSKSSHGFRPKRSCHTALQQIQTQFTGVTWFVEGDIHACFDSFDHHVLVDILRERIEDENFIALMWKMLKAGYMEQWVYNFAPFMAPKFEDNIILTQTERLMMSNRPANPKNARNKNVLIVGGSGSGKTRFWLKPNLLQCHSSYVVTDPNGYTISR